MGMWGQTATFSPSNFSGQGTSGTGSAISATVDGVTFACDKGYGTTQIRCYSGGTITISSSNTITAITFTFSGSYTGGLETSYTSLSTSSWTQTLGSQARITECSVSYTGGDTPQPTTYTVTYNANGGTGTMTDSNSPYNAGATVTVLGNEFTRTGYEFDHWNTAADDSGTSYDEDDTFTINANTTLYAQWTENTTPTPEGETATLNIQAYAEANSWENGVKYTTATVAPVTFTANGGGNTGKYYESGHDWRFYQGESASITISVPEGYTLVSVTPTYSVSNGGVLKNGNVTIASGTTVSVSGTSVTFTVGNSGSATNGQVRFTNIDVVYVSDGGTQTASDLTITNQSTDLTFDLYNNTTAQVISYTTSSTGAITITPAESDYFSYVHDATAKTITVTPTAVTPSAQTVTISQAADDDYYAGTATFTVSVANSDPNLPGTENNPYTVAQARAAIDAGTGTQGVYATGIVSAIPTAYNSTYGNVTFNMVDEEGDEVFLQAYRCGGDEAANVAVGDVAVVYGNLTKYGSTYEFGQGCQLISLTSSGIPSITADNVNIAADVTSGSIAYTINNPATNGTMAAETSSDWLTLGVGFDSPIAFTCTANTATSPRTATVTLTYTYNTNQTVTKEVTINQAAYEAPTYAELPFAFNGGKADIEGTDGLSQEGLGSDYETENAKLRFDDTGDWLLLQFNERPGTLTFDIKGNNFSGGTFKVQTSEDGTNYSDLATYTSDNMTTTVTSVEFTDLGENVRYIKWVYTEKVSGNVALGNIALAEYVEPVVVPSITFDPDVVDLEAEMQTIQIPFTYDNIVVTNYESFAVHHYDEEGEEIQNTPETPWYIPGVTGSNDEGYNLTVFVSANEGEARSAYMKVSALDAGGTTVYSNLVTVNQAAYVAPFEPTTYTLVTSLVSGKTYIIVGENDGDYYAMGEQRSSNRGGVAISVNGTTATVETADVREVVITALDGDDAGYYSIEDGGYLYAASSSGNQLKTKNELDVNGKWSITIDNGNFSIAADQSENRNVMQFNYNGNNPTIFSCYASANQSPVYLYVKDETPVTETYTLDISGYTGTGGYVLVASPVSTTPVAAGMITESNYDLYYYDDSQELEWINYKNEDGTVNSSFGHLTPGTGYLYANSANVTLTFAGEPYSGDGIFTPELGWNLIGNPYATAASLNLPFYRMNPAGSALVSVTEGNVNAMEGVFVEIVSDPETGDMPVVEFTPVNGKSVATLNLNVSQNRGNVIDNAIVRFDNGRILSKFQLFENSSKLYIPQGNKDFAIVRSAAQGEMPVSFRASENGTYTIAVEAENVDMNYLHLIDNMTGADVDLLATPNYTFEARTNDYTSRFRLVFSANGIDEQTAETFAFFNGTSWTVSNTGDATLQVVDITGRIISSETINGNATVSLNQPAGIYMLRLVNGNDVKVQKVVVR